jgi:hypothetical protein
MVLCYRAAVPQDTEPVRLEPEPRTIMRSLLTARAIFLVLAFIIVASAMVGQLWGTGFTCDDDMFSATAWQRLGGGAQGWTAIGRASWRMAVDQGRFYQLLPYTLTQAVYQQSFETVDVIRIGTMLFVFMAYAVMLVTVTRSFEFSLYCSILYAGLIETTYMFNPFHALPLWFNLGIGIMFVAISVFQEGLVRDRRGWTNLAALIYFVSTLFYEVFLFYCVVFFALAYLHLRTPLRSRTQNLVRAGTRAWAFGLSVISYVMLYMGFNRLYPNSTYTGKALSLASFLPVTRTIVGFSISGLNFKAVLPQSWQWSVPGIAVAFLVLSACLLSMGRTVFEMEKRKLLCVIGFGVICMLLPNILFGFTERYRHWIATSNNFYLGSFYSGSAEAVAIGGLSLWTVSQAARIRLGTITAVTISAFLTIAAYSNVRQAETFYRVHRNDRKVWNLVDASISKTGGLREAGIIVAPQLMQMSQLNTAIYDYWSFYFSEKFQHPVRVISKLSEFRALAPEARVGPVFALTCRNFPEFHVGLFAFGPLNVNAWQEYGELAVDYAQVGVLGNGADLFIFGKAPERPIVKMLQNKEFTLDEKIVNLDALSLGLYPR